ncbi:AfsR/SARP family transcriptional regulator [Micromonospora zhanjiangensis]|uniref:BTAD domain-containing putative transcriptional regulator n=1 Tax=Micromonospora zhanjiangensis TaxID=1522057 RepID=A0ABV8KPH3_9ACTN
MEFGLLGPLRVTRDGAELQIRAGGQRTLLATLLLRGNGIVPVDELVERLWETVPPPRPKAALHVQISRLRRALGTPDPIQTVPGGYRIPLRPGQLDLEVFDTLVRRAAASGEPAEQSRLLGEALGLWRGPALVDVACEALHRDVVPALAERRAQALERRIDADLRLRRHAELLPELRALTAESPLRERFWGLLMVVLYRSGRPAEALEAYRTARRLLIDVLGIEPGPELRRLERGVLAGDPELLHPVAAAPPVVPHTWTPQYQLPREVAGVVGRDRFVDELVDRLTGPGPVPVVAIYGGAGVGKSTLAVTVAHRVAGSFPDGQWYVRLDGAGRVGRDPVEVLGELLLAAGVPPALTPRGGSARAAALRARLAGRRVLLLLDDAADAAHVEDLLPGTAGSAVLVTSRRDLRGLAVRHGSHGLALPVLTAEAGGTLLATALGASRTGTEPGAVAELVELCARLPLALRIAAANLDLHRDRSIGSYVDQLRDGDRLSRLQVAGDSQAAVRAAFDLSYQGLDPAVARMFRLLGLIPGADSTAETAAVLLDRPEPEARRLLEALAATSLIQQHSPDRYRFHDLLRLYAGERARATDGVAERAEAIGRLLRYQLGRVDSAVAMLYPSMGRIARPAVAGVGFGTHREALAWLDAERVNLVAAARHAGTHGPAELTWHLADALRGYFAARRLDDDWEQVTSAGLAAAEAAGEPYAQSAMHHSLGLLHGYRAEYPPAHEHYQRAIALRQAAGRDDATGPLYNNLGMLYTSRGMNDEAKEYFRRGIAVERSRPSPSGIATKLANLATVEFAGGDLHAAVEHLREAAAILAVRDMSPSAHLRFTLGQCLHRLGDTTAAAVELTQALADSQETGYSLAAAYSLYGLSELRCDLDDLDGAAEYAAAALALAREIRSPAAEVDALTASGVVQRRRGEHLQAIALHTRALDLARTTDERRAGAITQVWLAAALTESGQPAPAREHASAALAATRRYGYRVSEARALAVLARLHLVTGAAAEAAEAARQAVALHRATGYRPPRFEAEILRAASG